MDRQEIEQTIKNYSWMIKEIKRQRQLLSEVNVNMTAQFGIESSMPKAQGITSDPVALEVMRRDRTSRWVAKLEEKVLFIQKRMYVISDPIEKAVLECMLDGMSMVAISEHLGLSRRNIYTIKESIITQIAHNAHVSQ